MAILKILTYPDRFLSNPAMPVEHIDEAIQTLIGNMAATLYNAPGVGARCDTGWAWEACYCLRCIITGQRTIASSPDQSSNC